jgi:hypothetical protein
MKGNFFFVFSKLNTDRLASSHLTLQPYMTDGNVVERGKQIQSLKPISFPYHAVRRW